MKVHLLLEEPTVPIRVETTLSIKQDDTGYYSASAMWDSTIGLGATPEGALLDYLQQELERLSLFSTNFTQGESDRKQTFIDSITGVYLIVDQDNPGYPGYPKLTFVCPTHTHLSVEKVNGAIARLQDMAKIPQEQRDPSPYTGGKHG